MPPPPQTPLIEATVVGPGDGSWFVAVPDGGGPPFDVHGVAPEDRVRLRPDPARPGCAVLVEVLAPGPLRRPAPCVLSAECGGCHWQHLDEAGQRELRRLRLEADLAVRDLAGAAPVSQIPAPEPLACRARARFQCCFSGGAAKVGLHRLGRRETLDVATCPVLSRETVAVYEWLRAELLDAAPADLTGFEITALPDAPGALVYLNPRDAEPSSWPALGERLLERSHGLVAGVAVRARCANGPDRLGADAVLGQAPGGGPVAAAARGFVQANLAAAERLAAQVARLTGAGDRPSVLELYAGAGFLGWRLARAGASVRAAEADPLAVAAAALLPALDPAGTLEIAVADAREAFAGSGGYDALLVDPPRRGLGALAHDIARRGPQRVVLVSCSTPALAADLAVLIAGGYTLHELVQVDLFPQTRHAETVALLERGPKTPGGSHPATRP